MDGWETAYYTNFSGSSGHGLQPMVVSYGTSPAAEVIYAETPVDDAPTASHSRTSIPASAKSNLSASSKGLRNRALAEKFVDFMLSQQFQEDMPLQMFVYPVNPECRTAGCVHPIFASSRTTCLSFDPEEIAANRDAWIEAWTDV